MIPEEDVRFHEAGHCAMALTVGVPVKLVALDRQGGHVEYLPHSHTRLGAVRRILVILGGLIETAPTGDDLPDWPLDPDAGPASERADRTPLADLAGRLQLTESQYSSLLGVALRISATSDYQRIVAAITGALDYTPRLDRAAIVVFTGVVV